MHMMRCEHRNISQKRICWFAVPLILIQLVLCMHSSVLMSSCSLCSHAGLPWSFPLGASVPGLSLLSWWTSQVRAFLPMFWQCGQSFQQMHVSVVGGRLMSCPPGLCLFLVLAVGGCVMSCPPVLAYFLLPFFSFLAFASFPSFLLLLSLCLLSQQWPGLLPLTLPLKLDVTHLSISQLDLSPLCS